MELFQSISEVLDYFPASIVKIIPTR
jgi:hypothetical protein